MKRFHIVFISVLLVLLIVPAVLFAFGMRDKANENRALSPKPVLIKNGRFNESFLSDFGEWFGDRFPFRSQLVEAFNTADAALLSDVGNRDAVIGKNGFIFFGETVGDYLGTNTLTEKELSSIVNYLADAEAKARENGAAFVFVIAPDKASVYPEYMPSYLRPTDNVKNIDALTAMLKERGVSVLDAKAILLEGKEERSVYYAEDSHWNNFGAALVYNALACVLGLETFDEHTYTSAVDRTGDLVRFVHPLAERFEERLIYPAIREWSSKRPVDFDMEKEIETYSSANGSTVLIFHDSFGRSLQPFFSQTAGRLVMNAYFPYDIQLVSELSPDAVVIELVERNLPLLAEYAASQGY